MIRLSAFADEISPDLFLQASQALQRMLQAMGWEYVQEISYEIWHLCSIS